MLQTFLELKMYNVITQLFFFLCSASLLYTQKIELSTPLEGIAGKDFFIVNYVDHDSSVNAIKDYQCGTQTYDGHQGTDFTLRSFAQMDSGVAVLSAADGVVFHVVDSLYDRNKVSIVERGFGNWIGIAHEGGWRTYYAHVRTNSALVKPGDRVVAGDATALVGSSGNSTDPHLHFEVWKIDTVLHDPFGPGSCGVQPSSLWKNQLPYDTEYKVIDYGLLNWVPTLDTLRERPTPPTSFALPDSVVTFWIHQQGLRTGDVIRVEWRRTVDNALWFEYEFPVSEQDWWYHYFWTYINLPPSDQYVVRYFINNREIIAREFDVDGSNAVEDETPVTGISIRYLPGDWNILSLTQTGNTPPSTLSLTLFDQSGKRVGKLYTGEVNSERTFIDLAPLKLSAGLYFLQIVEKAGIGSTLPIFVSQ